jgi:aromatic-L-amino-acid decarboxylase
MSDSTRRDPESQLFVWPADEIRKIGYQAVDLIADHLASIPDTPVFRPLPATTADAWMATPAPTAGTSAESIVAQFAADIAPYPFGNGHPRFYGWVNSPPAPIGIVAAALAATMNPSVAGGNHAAVWIERQVLDWFKAFLGFPTDSMGLLVSGASAAAITGLAVARHVAHARRGWDVRADGVHPAACRVYISGEGHSAHYKAVELLGLGRASIRAVPTDGALRMRPDALDTMVANDIAAGLLPVAIVASAGTVNTGAIDPLDAIADVAARHGVWLHIDGAYGAPAILTDQYRHTLAPLARADSVAVDPHKWLYVPVDAGMVLVRDARALRDTFSLVPAYIRTDDNIRGVQGPPWFSEYGTEQTRPFRALKVWMAMRYFGLDGYRALIGHDIAMARYLADRVRATPGLELWEPTSLSIVCFRRRADDAVNRAVLQDVQLGGQAFLSGTEIDGRYWLRACIVNPRATESDIDAMLDAIQRAAADIDTGPAGR